MNIIPRFQGNAIQIGKHWGWELCIRIGEAEPIWMGSKEGANFLNKEAALNDLRHHTAEVMRIVCESLGLPPPDSVLDLNKGIEVQVNDIKKPVTYS